MQSLNHLFYCVDYSVSCLIVLFSVIYLFVKYLFQIAYIVFLVIMTYVVLVRMSRVPTKGEYYVIAYVFTMAIDKIREVGDDNNTQSCCSTDSCNIRFIITMCLSVGCR